MVVNARRGSEQASLLPPEALCRSTGISVDGRSFCWLLVGEPIQGVESEWPVADVVQGGSCMTGSGLLWPGGLEGHAWCCTGEEV